MLIVIRIKYCYNFTVMESWQSGNAADSKSAEPAITGAQVQILYSPYQWFICFIQTPQNVDFAVFLFFMNHMF